MPDLVNIEGGEIVIRVKIDALPIAVGFLQDLTKYDEKSGEFFEARVTDPRVLAEEIVRALRQEQEDGTTPIHEMFDAAVGEAVEQGAEGIVLHGDEGYDAAPKVAL